ncbi:MAG: xanthine dehydrogenase family protein subunit M [Gemmatimonadota bacterium]|nr:xanthine dehydrogenase family protein subunit M [Gemmatimonadota bacterium]
MKPPPFEYRAPDSLGEALDLMGEHGWDAKPLAGGQSLVPAMNFRLAAPAILVDLQRIDGLAGIRETDGGLAIGAMTTQREAERSDRVAGLAPLLHEAMPFVAHPQIRNRGTVGGSVAHADPAAELPAVLLALGASFRAASRDEPGGRWIDAADFFQGLFATALSPEELLVEVAVPAPAARSGAAFDEFSRRHGDYALAGVAAVVELDEAGRCADARATLLSVADGPFVAEAVPATLAGEEPTGEALADAAAAVAAEIDPPSDIHASAEYRRHLAEVLVRRTLGRAAGRARGDVAP